MNIADQQQEMLCNKSQGYKRSMFCAAHVQNELKLTFT